MLLRAENLSKRFGGVHAVRAVGLEIAAGAVHSIIGPNGAGKTTLLNLLSGIYRPDDRVHRARPDLQVDRRHGEHAAEALSQVCGAQQQAGSPAWAPGRAA